MNDFTKEELQHIYDALWMLSKLGWNKSDLTYCKKIGAMIESYCEHDNQQMDCNGGISLVCNQCGKTMVDI